jgi:SSS family solute:Na+ symporter
MHMMKHLSGIDISIILIYLAAMVFMGIYSSRKNKNTDEFTKASGKIPGWALGLSIYATFLSSNTFLGVPGKAFGSNWNYFAFSLSMPISAWVATRYFIPFYRQSGEISAYTHFEHRFGPWARTYAVVCFLLSQLARMGSVFFGIALTVQALTGYSMEGIMVSVGTIIIIYTMMGGMKAVIWTEVVQATIKTLGALLIAYFLVSQVPGGLSHILDVGKADHKFSLGSFRPGFTASTFWVIFLYGIFINLNNFGMDQNYVQRYHATNSGKTAANSMWLCVKLYIPISLLFFVIGTSLYVWYQGHPEMLQLIKLRAAAEQASPGTSAMQLSQGAASLKPDAYGDKALPDFMTNALPVGILGLIVSALLSAAMSTISSGMNASATVFTFDIYKRYIHPGSTPKQDFRVLILSTGVLGILAISTGILLIGVKSILDTWWQLSGIFAAGMLGLFLLSLVSRRVRNPEAILATIIGILVIFWMSLSAFVPISYPFLRHTINSNLIVVVGTLTIFLSGMLLSWLKKALRRKLL